MLCEIKLNHKQESFYATRWCLFTKTYINRFSGNFLVQKYKRTNTLKVEYAIEMKFLSEKWIMEVNIRVNLLTFTAGRQAAGFHVLESMWTTSRVCAVAFKSPRPLPVGGRRPIRCQCLRSLFLLRFLGNSSAILCSKKERNLQPFSPSLHLPRQLNDRAAGCHFSRLISKTDVNCIDISKHPPNLLGASYNPGHSSKSSFVISHKNEI